MSLLSDYKTKLDIARDRRRPGQVRAFAIAELVCQPVSFLSVIAVVAFTILRRAGVWSPPAAVSAWAIPILVSAAVGYLTNWIAIMAEHLGAIQVLGYVLGAVAGLFLALC